MPRKYLMKPPCNASGLHGLQEPRLFPEIRYGFRLVLQDRIDALQYRTCEHVRNIERPHVLLDLLGPRGTSDHGADIRILEAPGECELREGAAQLTGNWRKLPDLLDL